jgi:hypothetical protein
VKTYKSVVLIVHEADNDRTVQRIERGGYDTEQNAEQAAERVAFRRSEHVVINGTRQVTWWTEGVNT